MNRRKRKTFSIRSGNDMKHFDEHFGKQVVWVRRKETPDDDFTLCVKHALAMFPEIKVSEVEIATSGECLLCANYKGAR